MKRTVLMNIVIAAAFCLGFNLVGIQTGEAVEEHHKLSAMEKKTPSIESPSQGMMPGSAGTSSGSGMMGMTGGPDIKNGQGMMGQGMMNMMSNGMMSMMMAHMMGGPGGMGKMMVGMGPGMMGRDGGPKAAIFMARMLENLNLTPEQWTQVRSLAREQLDKMADLWAQSMKLQIELASLRWDKEINEQRVKEVFVKEAEVEADMFLAGLSYLHGLKAILTPDQLQILESQGY